MRELLEAWLARAQRGLAIVAVAGLSSCSSGDNAKQASPVSEAVLASCVVAPYSPMAVSLQSLVNTLEERGFDVAWEAHGSNFILRSRRNDHLTGQATVIDFDVQFDGGQAEAITSDACGPGRAVISRIQTNEGVHQGLAVDQLLLAMALIAEPPAPPLRQEETGSHEVAEGLPKAGEANGTCDVTLEGRRLMSGACQGLFHDDRVVLSSQQAEGCHVDLRWEGNAAAASVYSYRNPCLSPATGEPLDADVPLGVVVKEGQCWVNEAVRVCLER